MCDCVSHVVLYSAVVQGWVETESQIINAEEREREQQIKKMTSDELHSFICVLPTISIFILMCSSVMRAQVLLVLSSLSH